MRFAFTDEQEQLRQSARAFLDSHASSAAVRRAMACEHGFDPDVWRRIGGELGWASLVIPEAYGGAGLGQVELTAIMEEMGRALLCAPFFSTVAVVANALVAHGSEAQKAEHLPGIAAGETLGALAFPGAGGLWDAAGVDVQCERDGGDFLLRGAAGHVVCGGAAHLFLVPARAPRSSGDEGVSLFCVPASAEGLSRRALTTMDMTRRQAEVRLDGVRVPRTSLVGGEGEGAASLARVLDVAAAALAAEQVGGADRCLAMSVDHANVRVQFGRPIGSFQAIKHMCADMLVRVESARSAAYYAGWAAEHAPDELAVAAAMAKAYCSEAYFHCASQSLQIHGGIGFTWEHDAHLYFKRARADEAWLGTPAFHRERVARLLAL